MNLKRNTKSNKTKNNMAIRIIQIPGQRIFLVGKLSFKRIA